MTPRRVLAGELLRVAARAYLRGHDNECATNLRAAVKLLEAHQEGLA